MEVIEKVKNFDIGYAIVEAFRYVYGLFGLLSFKVLKNGEVVQLKWQRFPAAIFLVIVCTAYILCKIGNFPRPFSFRNSLVMVVIPALVTILANITMIVIYVCTHFLTSQRKLVFQLLSQVQRYLNSCNRESSIFALDYSAITMVGSALLLYGIYECFLFAHLPFPKDLCGAVSFLTLYSPNIAFTAFEMEYTIMMTTLRSYFRKLNVMLTDAQMESWKSPAYGSDERAFKKHVMTIVDYHKMLTKAGRIMNVVFSVQLLLSISVLFNLILSDAYVSIYFFLTATNWEEKYFGVFTTATLLILHCFLLLTLVETSSTVCNEVSIEWLRMYLNDLY